MRIYGSHFDDLFQMGLFSHQVSNSSASTFQPPRLATSTKRYARPFLLVLVPGGVFIVKTKVLYCF